MLKDYSFIESIWYSHNIALISFINKTKPSVLWLQKEMNWTKHWLICRITRWDWIISIKRPECALPFKTSHHFLIKKKSTFSSICKAKDYSVIWVSNKNVVALALSLLYKVAGPRNCIGIRYGWSNVWQKSCIFWGDFCATHFERIEKYRKRMSFLLKLN